MAGKRCESGVFAMDLPVAFENIWKHPWPPSKPNLWTDLPAAAGWRHSSQRRGGKPGGLAGPSRPSRPGVETPARTFRVGAVRQDGKTKRVRVKSLAGEPCRLRPGLEVEVRCTVPLKPAGQGAYDLTLAKGEEAILYTCKEIPALAVAPVMADPARCNYYGLPVETGKPSPRK